MFDAPCLSTASRVAKFTDIGTTVTGVLATGVTITAGIVALPAIAVGTAIGAGIGCAVYSLGRGINSLMDRGKHEQSININNTEARNCWLGVGGSVVGLAAGGATKALSMAAENGKNISKVVLHRYIV